MRFGYLKQLHDWRIMPSVIRYGNGVTYFTWFKFYIAWEAEK